MLAVPGINPVIPLGWGIIAFVVSLVIHEFGHGLLARGHGMRIRSFGLLQLGPLPLGAFAEPQSDELMRAPRRERLRMFAAGPATNLFAAFIMFLLLGGIATQFVGQEDYIHVQGIVVDAGADEAGMQPWDTLVSIDGVPVHTTDDFRTILTGYGSNDTVDLVVIHENGSRVTHTSTTATLDGVLTILRAQAFSLEIRSSGSKAFRRAPLVLTGLLGLFPLGGKGPSLSGAFHFRSTSSVFFSFRLN
jgi:membrane-associated protease RseP (regulator of RpoE activity)